MSAWAGFWIMVGLIVLGVSIDNGLCCIGRALGGKRYK
jgi:hypothetical protein